MKKLLSLILTLVLIVSLVPLNAFALPNNSNVKTRTAMINNYVDNNVKTIIYQNDPYISVRSLSELLGASLSWDQNSKTAIMKWNGVTYKFVVDSNLIYLNDKAETIFSDNILYNNKVYAPLEFIADYLDWQVYSGDSYMMIDDVITRYNYCNTGYYFDDNGAYWTPSSLKTNGLSSKIAYNYITYDFKNGVESIYYINSEQAKNYYKILDGMSFEEWEQNADGIFGGITSYFELISAETSAAYSSSIVGLLMFTTYAVQTIDGENKIDEVKHCINSMGEYDYLKITIRHDNTKPLLTLDSISTGVSPRSFAEYEVWSPDENPYGFTADNNYYGSWKYLPFDPEFILNDKYKIDKLYKDLKNVSKQYELPEEKEIDDEIIEIDPGDLEEFPNESVSEPVVSDLEYANLSSNSITVYSYVIDTGNSYVTDYGFRIKNKTNGESYNYISLGSCNEPTQFSLNITWLEPGCKYYISSYAKNCEGTDYSKRLEITTPESNDSTDEPTVELIEAEFDASYPMMTLYGKVDGNGEKVEYGFISRLKNSDNEYEYSVDDTRGSETYSYNIGVDYGEIYYIKAYAKDSDGNYYYSEETRFKCE